MQPSHISITEAAAIMGRSRQWVATLIKRGRLPAVKTGGVTLVSRKACERYNPKPPGRPKT